MLRITDGGYLSQSVNADVEMLGELLNPDKPPASVPANYTCREGARRWVQQGRAFIRVRFDQLAQKIHWLLCLDLLLAGLKRKIQETDRCRTLLPDQATAEHSQDAAAGLGIAGMVACLASGDCGRHD